MERFNSEFSSIDSTNWGSTELDSGGTPGIINSISQRDYDIEISQLNFEPIFPLYGEQVRISANLKNIGKNNLTCALQLFEDVDLDTTNFQLLETRNLLLINSGDSISVEFEYAVDSIKGARAFLVEVFADIDQDTSNNRIYGMISPGYPRNTLVINEILYSPINGEPEWIELYNTSNEEVNLKNWLVSDIYTTPKIIEITDQKLLIQGNEYFVIAKDSTIWEYHKSIVSSVLITNFANLNNDIDGVVLKDQYGNLIDSVQYKFSWGGTSGHSLERRFHTDKSNDSTNWNSSIDIELSTPGKKNSITPKNFDLKISS
ncbi:MAG: lamin tail domain-containing protein, partial [Melioribacteraceae bacterium]|nr:lamin tail domain-containing protein [Melioribacteraceae bacterium]